MFRASTDRLRSWLTHIDQALDDVLGDPTSDVHGHPHRVPLRWKPDRRGGSIPPRPAHCVSPVRAGAAERLHAAAR